MHNTLILEICFLFFRTLGIECNQLKFLSEIDSVVKQIFFSYREVYAIKFTLLCRISATELYLCCKAGEEYVGFFLSACLVKNSGHQLWLLVTSADGWVATCNDNTSVPSVKANGPTGCSNSWQKIMSQTQSWVSVVANELVFLTFLIYLYFHMADQQLGKTADFTLCHCLLLVLAWAKALRLPVISIGQTQALVIHIERGFLVPY